MNARRPLIAVFLLVVAGAAFQAGRASVAVPAGPERAAVAGAHRAKSVTGHHTPPPASLEEVIRNIASVSSRDAYVTMKGASIEALEAAVRQLEAIPIAPQRSGAIAAFFKVLMQVNPAEAKRLLQELTQENRWTAIYAIKNAAPPRAMQQVVEVLSQQERSRLSGCGFNHMRDAIDEWSRTDPTAAHRFIEEHPESELDFYTPTVVRNLAAYDPDAAMTLLVREIEKAHARQTIDQPGEAASFTRHIVSRWAEGFFEHDPAAALDYLVANSAESTISDAIPLVTGSLFKESPDEARSFIMRLPEELRGEAIAAAAWAAESTTHGDADDAIRSPEFIADWMLTFPDHSWSTGIPRVVLDWRAKDRATLFSWIAGLPSHAQSAVAAAYTPHLTPDEADAEVSALMNIPHAALRDQLLAQTMANAGGARSKVLVLLAATPLSIAQKEYLTSLIPTDSYEVPEVPADE